MKPAAVRLRRAVHRSRRRSKRSTGTRACSPAVRAWCRCSTCGSPGPPGSSTSTAIPGLGVLRRSEGTLRIGATVRQAALERSALVAHRWPLLAQAVRHVGHAATRARGTVAGSVAHADPAAQLPVALTALGAHFELRSAAGTRTLIADEFFQGPLTTALEPGELLVAIHVPALKIGARTAFVEHARTRGDFPQAGAAVVLARGHAAVAVLGTGSHPVRATRAEAALVDGASAARGGGARRRERRGRSSPGAGGRAHAPRARPGGPRMRLRINGVEHTAEVEPRTLLSRLHPGRGPHGHQGRLRAGRVRRLHGAARRRAGAVLPDARDPGRRLRRRARSRASRPARCSSPSTSTTRSSAASARPGILMTLDAYLREHPDPTADEVREALAGNLCRCTGYRPIVEAVLQPMRLRSRYDREILLLARAGARRARLRAALRARRHRDRRPPRHDAARVAGDRRDGARRPRSRSSTSSPTAPRRRWRACTARGATPRPRGSARRRCGSGSGSGVLLLVLLQVLAVPIVELMGGEGEVKDGAVLYLRIAALGAPLFMLASAAQGFLRGMGDLRTPLLILVAAHALNVFLEVLFVYGFGWGLAGSAWGTVIAQVGMAGGVLRRPVARRARASASGEDAPADADRVRDRGPHDRAHRLVPGRLGGAGADRRGVARRAPDRVPAVGVPRARSSTRSRSPGR